MSGATTSQDGLFADLFVSLKFNSVLYVVSFNYPFNFHSPFASFSPVCQIFAFFVSTPPALPNDVAPLLPSGSTRTSLSAPSPAALSPSRVAPMTAPSTAERARRTQCGRRGSAAESRYRRRYHPPLRRGVVRARTAHKDGCPQESSRRGL